MSIIQFKFTDVVTIANFITIVRVVLLFPLFYFLEQERTLLSMSLPAKDVTLIVLLIGFFIGLSDFLDGKVARLLKQSSDFGKFLDPICDKIVLFLGLGLMFYYRSYSVVLILFLYLREFTAIYLGWFLYYKKDMQIEPNIWGKWGIASVSLSVLWYLALPLLPPSWPNPAWSYLPVVILYFTAYYFYAKSYWKIYIGTVRK